MKGQSILYIAVISQLFYYTTSANEHRLNNGNLRRLSGHCNWHEPALDPTQVQPEPTEPAQDPTQVQPVPIEPIPEPTPVQPVPTEPTPEPTQVQPVSTEPIPESTQPAPTQPAPTEPIPEPIPEPTQEQPTPTETEPYPAQVQPAPTQEPPKPSETVPEPTEEQPKPTLDPTQGEQKPTGTVPLYVGTYTQDLGWVVGQGEGVYTFDFNPADGSLVQKNVVKVGNNPIYVTGTSETLYVANMCEDSPGGCVTALSITKDTNTPPKPLSTFETYGLNPCHVALSPSEKYISVANYENGTVSLFPVDGKDGDIKQASDLLSYSQDKSHLHSTIWVPKTNFMFAADLGLDSVYALELDEATGKLDGDAAYKVMKSSPGSGPRHMAIHPTLNVLYIVHETLNFIVMYNLDRTTGALSVSKMEPISTLPTDAAKESKSADIHITSDGKYLFTSNRAPNNSIARFSIDEKTGFLKFLGAESSKGATPRGFLIHGHHMIVANQDSSTIEVFNIESNGDLTFIQETKCPTPVSLFIPSA